MQAAFGDGTHRLGANTLLSASTSPVASSEWRIERFVATRQWETKEKISPYRKSQLR